MQHFDAWVFDGNDEDRVFLSDKGYYADGGKQNPEVKPLRVFAPFESNDVPGFIQGLAVPIALSLAGSQVLVYEHTYSPGYDIYVVGLADGRSGLNEEQKETLRDFNQPASPSAIMRQLNQRGGCIYQSLTEGYRTVKTLILMKFVMPEPETANDSSFCYSAGVFYHLGARGAMFRSIDDMYPAEARDGKAKLIPFSFDAHSAAVRLLYARRSRPDAPGFAGGEDRQTALGRVRLMLSFADGKGRGSSKERRLHMILV